MTKYDPKMFEAEMRSAPRRVRYTCTISWLLATLLSVRFFMFSSASAKASLFFLTLIFFNFVFNGVAIVARSKFSYVLLAFFSSLSLLGAIEASIDLIGLLLTGEWQNNSTGVTIGLFGVIVTAIISLLFRNLFSKEVRVWVWSSKPITEPSQVLTI
jgi:membrane-associated HD superfamily phosphohydrolase